MLVVPFLGLDFASLSVALPGIVSGRVRYRLNLYAAANPPRSTSRRWVVPTRLADDRRESYSGETGRSMKCGGLGIPQMDGLLQHRLYTPNGARTRPKKCRIVSGLAQSKGPPRAPRLNPKPANVSDAVGVCLCEHRRRRISKPQARTPVRKWCSP